MMITKNCGYFDSKGKTCGNRTKNELCHLHRTGKVKREYGERRCMMPIFNNRKKRQFDITCRNFVAKTHDEYCYTHLKKMNKYRNLDNECDTIIQKTGFTCKNRKWKGSDHCYRHREND